MSILPARDGNFNLGRRYRWVERVEISNCRHGQALNQLFTNVNFSAMFSKYSWAISCLKICSIHSHGNFFDKSTKYRHLLTNVFAELSERRIPVVETSGSARDSPCLEVWRWWISFIEERAKARERESAHIEVLRSVLLLIHQQVEAETFGKLLQAECWISSSNAFGVCGLCSSTVYCSF